MKLYAWQPDGHGQKSFFVCAESESEAYQSVLDVIKKGLALHRARAYGDPEILDPYDVQGWGTNYYKLTVSEPGVVVCTDND